MFYLINMSDSDGRAVLADRDTEVEAFGEHRLLYFIRHVSENLHIYTIEGRKNRKRRNRR